MLNPSIPKAVTGNELVFPLPGGPATTIIRGRITRAHPVSSVVSESGNMSGGSSGDTSLPSAPEGNFLDLRTTAQNELLGLTSDQSLG